MARTKNDSLLRPTLPDSEYFHTSRRPSPDLGHLGGSKGKEKFIENDDDDEEGGHGLSNTHADVINLDESKDDFGPHTV